MKRRIVANAAGVLLVLGLRASAQGYFYLDTQFVVTNRADIDAPGNRYNGSFGLEVWMRNGTNVPAGLNNLAALSGVAAHNAMLGEEGEEGEDLGLKKSLTPTPVSERMRQSG